MKKEIVSTIALSVLTNTLLAVQTPNIGDIEKQIQTPKIKKEKAIIPKVKIKEYKKPMQDNGKTIFVKKFIFTGNIHVDKKELEKLAQDYENKDLSFSKINELNSLITKYYRENGYFVARAYLPKQKIKDNILKLAIIEGNYGEFKLENSSYVKNSIVQGILDYAKRDDVVSIRTLEQSMLLINDLPGVQVSQADITPGKKVGSSDFIIKTEKTKKYDGYILVDNAGSRYTDQNRALVGVNFNSPFSIGDKISFSGLLSNETNLKNGRVSYIAPLMSNGLTGEIAYSQTNYSLTEEYENLDAKGNSKNLEANFKYPILRTRRENLYATLNFAHKKLKDEIESTDDITKKDANTLSLGLEYDKNYVLGSFNSLSNVKVNLTYGKLDFKDNDKKQQDKAGVNTNGNFSKINLDLTHNMLFTPKISLESSFKMQYALGDKNLDGSEDFSLGGAYGVKLYPSGELSAENGYLLNVELKYTLPTVESYNHNIGIFYDRGRVFMSDNKNVEFNDRALQDIGLSYYVSYEDFFAQVQTAWKVNSAEVQSEADRNSKILFQAGWVF